MDLAKLALSVPSPRQRRMAGCDLQRPVCRGGGRYLRRIALQYPEMVLRGAARGAGGGLAAEWCPRLFVDAGIQPINVVAGRHRGSLRTACSSDRGVSHSVLFMGAPSRE